MTGETQSGTRSYMALILSALFVLMGIWGGNLLTSRFSRTLSGAILLPCNPSQDVQIMGDKTLYYDGVQLRALNSQGRIAWNSLLGANNRYEASIHGVTTWKENTLTLLNTGGVPLYTARLDRPILRAVQGPVYAAVHVGTEFDGEVLVVDKTGRQVDRVALNRRLVMDMGFFSSSGDMLYVMLLDTEGTAPRTTVSMYKPAKMMTGTIVDRDQLIYATLFSVNQIITVGTDYVRRFDYTGKESESERTLVYGWQLKAARGTNAGVSSMLFAQSSQAQGASRITDVRAIDAASSVNVHFPVECFALFGGEKSFYGFSRQYAFVATYGKRNIGTMILPKLADNIIGINTANQALLVSGQEIFLLPLP